MNARDLVTTLREREALPQFADNELDALELHAEVERTDGRRMRRKAAARCLECGASMQGGRCPFCDPEGLG